VVKNNYFTRIARDYHSSIGIFSGITMGTLIEHNELFDMPYTGINGGWFGEDKSGKPADTPHKNTTIHYNKIHNVANLMSDGAGIYTLGKQPGTKIFENYIFDLHKSPWAGGNLIAGVYLDGSSNITVENNIVEDTNLGHYIGAGLSDILINLSGTIRDDLPSAQTYINNGNIDPNSIKANAGIEPAFQSILSEGTSVNFCSTVNAQIQTGYDRIQPRFSSAITSGLAVVGYRRDGFLVSEAAFPASSLMRSGRIYTEIQDSVNTGISITNPNTVPVNLDFLLTDAGGAQVYFGSTSIAANGHITAFLNEPPFAPPPNVPLGGVRTFTFSASSPIAFAALRGFANERTDFLMTPLPVAELNSTNTSPIAFPYYVDGAGWETEIQLVNPTDSVISGVVNFFPALNAASSDPDFFYEIPSRSAVKLRTSNLGSERRTGWVRVSPMGGVMPSGLLLFSFHRDGVTLSQAGIQGTGEASGFQLYAGTSGAFGLVEQGSMETGFAVSNPASTEAVIALELLAADGTPTGNRGSLTVPANGQITMFLEQVPGFQSLQTPFVGLLRISGGPVAVVGLKGRVNERGDFLLTPMPAVAQPALTPSLEVFSFFADGAGYSTQSIVFGSFGEIVLP